MRLPCPSRVILYAVLLCHNVQVCFGSDPLPKLLNTCELSVVTLSAAKRGTHGAGEARWDGQPRTKGHPCHAVVTGEGTDGCTPSH